MRTLGVGEQDALSWQRTASFLGRFGYGEEVEQPGASQFARVIVEGTCVAGAAAYTVGDWVPLQLDEPLVATTAGAWIGMPVAKHHEQPAFWAMFRAKTTPSMMDVS